MKKLYLQQGQILQTKATKKKQTNKKTCTHTETQTHAPCQIPKEAKEL